MKNLRKYMSPVLVCLIATAWGCHPKSNVPAKVEPTTTAAPVVEKPQVGPFEASTLKAPGRVVAIGDIHGDFDAMQRSLRAGGVVDESGAWVGGDATLVQTGDVLDRGDDEQQIIDYLDALRDEAKAAGGQVVLLNGNHEIMNVAGDLRYVTPGGFADFADVPGLDLTAPVLAQFPEHARPRMAAFMPGGPYARKLAERRVIAIVNDSVFVHGGVLAKHAEYGIDAINEQTSAWMRGERDAPLILQGDDAPIWTRIYSDGKADCPTLEKALTALGAARMVVGHTVQKQGVTSDCDGKIWRIDVGMSAHYGGQPGALEISGADVRPLTAATP